MVVLARCKYRPTSLQYVKMPLTKAPKRRLKKGAEKKVPEKPKVSLHQPNVPLELQQWILDIFQDAYLGSLNNSLASTIQEIKQRLFERDFVKAFGNPAYLEAYTARWSPTRALTYLDILCSLPAISTRLSNAPQTDCVGEDLAKVRQKLSVDGKHTTGWNTPLGTQNSIEGSISNGRHKIVCLGAGGGAELLAFAGLLHRIGRHVLGDSSSGQSQKCKVAQLDCVLVDVADWSSVLQKLHSSATTTTIPITQDTPTQREENDAPSVKASQFIANIVQQDVLNVSQADLGTTLGRAALVTIMFTLNELYSTSIGSTTKMLLSLTSLLKPRALLLVVDSPGSYSTVSLRKSAGEAEKPAPETGSDPNAKKYPMQWLLDHTLLDSATIKDSENRPHKQWRKLESQESRWFRLPSQLEYPIELEDMRYQLHLYERMGETP